MSAAVHLNGSLAAPASVVRLSQDAEIDQADAHSAMVGGQAFLVQAITAVEAGDYAEARRLVGMSSNHVGSARHYLQRLLTRIAGPNGGPVHMEK